MTTLNGRSLRVDKAAEEWAGCLAEYLCDLQTYPGTGVRPCFEHQLHEDASTGQAMTGALAGSMLAGAFSNCAFPVRPGSARQGWTVFIYLFGGSLSVCLEPSMGGDVFVS